MASLGLCTIPFLSLVLYQKLFYILMIQWLCNSMYYDNFFFFFNYKFSMHLDWRFTSCICVFLFFFFFFLVYMFQLSRDNMHRLMGLMHYSRDPQILYSEKNIKNGSHITIHIFKNYFSVLFLIFSF